MVSGDPRRVFFASALAFAALILVGQPATVAQDPSAAPGTPLDTCPTPVAPSSIPPASPIAAIPAEGSPSPAVGPTSAAASPGPAVSPTPFGCPTGAVVEAVVRDFEFEPAELVVDAGTTVRWTNGGPSVHTVTAEDGSFDSGAIAPGTTFELTFEAEGTYPYFCVPHPTMTGTIIVR